MPRFAFTLTAAGIVGLTLLTAASAQESPPLGPTDSAGTGATTSDAGDTSPGANTSDRIGGTPTEPRESPANPDVDRPASDADQPLGAGARSDIQVDSQRGAFLRASSFIGRPVRGTADAQLGTVGDILIDPRTYEMRYVLLDTGTGVGTNGLPIIPWMLFRTTSGSSLSEDFLYVPMSLERLGQAPVTTLGAEDLLWNSAWVNRVDEFYVSDLTERRMSRPELEAESTAQSRGAQATQEGETTPGANDTPRSIRERRQGTTARDGRDTGAVQNPTRARPNATRRTPGSTNDARRNRGPATGTPGAASDADRNRGPGNTTPGSATDPARKRGPAAGTPGATDDASRSRGPESSGTPGATPGAGTTSGATGSGTGTGNTSGGTGASGGTGGTSGGTGGAGAGGP